MNRIILIALLLLPVLRLAGNENQSPNQALIDKATEHLNSGNLNEALTIDLGLVDKLKTQSERILLTSVLDA